MSDGNRMEPRCCACGGTDGLHSMNQMYSLDIEFDGAVAWSNCAESMICSECAMAAFIALWESGEFGRLYFEPTKKAWAKYAKNHK